MAVILKAMVVAEYTFDVQAPEPMANVSYGTLYGKGLPIEVVAGRVAAISSAYRLT